MAWLWGWIAASQFVMFHRWWSAWKEQSQLLIVVFKNLTAFSRLRKKQQIETAITFHSFCSSSGSSKSPSSKSPESANFALTDMQHSRERRRTSAVKFNSAVSYLVVPWDIWLCREIFFVPWHPWATVGLYCSLILEDPTTLFQSEFDFLLFVMFLCRDLH